MLVGPAGIANLNLLAWISYGGALTLMVVYGYHAESNDDPFLTLAQECVELLSNKIASTGSIWIVDVIPACKFLLVFIRGQRICLILATIVKHLPDWFPGASFKRKAKEWKAKMEEFTDRPYEWMKNELVRCRFSAFFLEDSAKGCNRHMVQPGRLSAHLFLKKTGS